MAEVLLMIALGLVIGTVLGALGGGGSVLAVPVLVYAADASAQTATAASLVVVGLGATGGLVSHLRAGNVRVVQGLVFGAVGIAGALVGTWANQAVSETVLLTSFATLLLVVAAKMLASRDTEPHGDGRVHPWRVLLSGTGVGLLTGFLGVGGGFVVVPALVLSLGFRMPTAVGTSLVVILVNAGVSLVARIGSVDIPWGVTLALAAGTATAQSGVLSA